MKKYNQNRRNPLGMAEREVLRLIQDLYGHRWHGVRDCYVDSDGQHNLFIKNKSGEAQFSVNLTLLAQIKSVMETSFVQKHLIREASSCNA